MSRLSKIIIEKIKNEGPISFRDFMEMALYYPELGYYTSPSEKIGRTGDFYTTPYITSAFGELIGKQLEEIWRLMGEPYFTVAEYGAGTGLLCTDILNYLQKNSALYGRLQYCIIERSPSMREKQRAIPHGNIRWCDSVQELAPLTGCVLSNELLDNFSVHQVIMEAELMEVFVDYQDGFKEVLRHASEALKTYFADLNVILPAGYRTEVNLQARDWIAEIASVLDRGFVLTIDYGFPASELYQESRSSGTLVCYHQHKLNDNPYEAVGEQDITAHVNFSALDYWGSLHGLELCGFTEQGNFLRALGLTSYLRQLELSGEFALADNRKKLLMIHTLLMDMGRKLKVLVQKKGLPGHQLSGLAFCSTRQGAATPLTSF